MQIRLTVLGPLGGHTHSAAPAAHVSCDVLVTAPVGTALAGVASGLAAAVAAAGSDLGTGAVAVYAGTERLDPQRCALGEPPLIDGAVLSLNVPADPERHAGVLLSGVPESAARLHVVSGPDAGGVHLLHGGEVRVGRSSGADVPLDDPDVSRLHCAVTLSDEDGSITLHDLGSTNGTVLNGERVDGRAVPFPPGSLLRVGESTLILHAGPCGDASEATPRVLPASPDGEGHLRVGQSTSAEQSVKLPGQQTATEGRTGTPLPHSLVPAQGGREAPLPAAAVPGVPAQATAAEPAAVPAPTPAPDAAPQAQRPPAAARATIPPQAAPPEHPPRTGDFEQPGHQPSAGPTGYATGTLGFDGGTVRRPAPAHSGYAGHTPGAAGTVRGIGSASFTPGGHDDPSPETLGGRGLPLAVEADLDVAADDPAEPRRGKLGRGIGAWARRLATGRGTAQRGSGEDPEADGPESEAGQALATAAALRGRWPDPAAVLLTALGPGPHLWERGPHHPDLLTVRLGTADRGLLPSVPVTVSLRQAGALGLAGPRERLSGLARSVLSQLAALHRPATLEYVLISADRARPAEERLAEWSWLGWLPHARPAHGQDCRLLLAYDREQAEARTAELVRRLDDGPLGPGWATAPPEAVAAAAVQHRGPYTVLIVDGDPGSTALRDTVARLAGSGAAAGVHVVCLAEAPATTPSSPVSATLATAQAASPAFAQCGAVALLSGDVATVVQVIQRAPAGSQGPVVPAVVPAVAGTTLVAAVDAVSAAWAERFARALAPLRMAEGAGADGEGARVAAVLPRAARLLDELGLARATPASLTARWAAATDRGARPGGRAVAVLGAGPHGPLAVDLAGDGPHLLVEGGPGSGKTELLRSLAASLAAADRPDRLSLVLVDGAAAERGEGLRMCTDLPHVSTYLAASDPVRMREFAQALASELKRRAELLGTLDFCAWHDRNPAPPAPDAPGVAGARGGDLDSPPSGTLKLRTQRGGPTRTAETALPRLVVLVDDFDALVAPALGSTGRPAAGSVVRALEAVARDGERLGVHLIAASGRPDRTADTAAVERAGLRATLEIAPAAEATGSGADSEPAPGRGRLQRPDDGGVTPFQAGRVTGRIPRTATLRPTVVALDWQRMGDPPARRPVRELGNGPTDLALLASALQRAAQSAGVQAAPPLL
ncbi:FtsK/SpoIIIE domain-containing protein [Streptomyces sp. NPDC002536]